MNENLEHLQILNAAIIKTREKSINSTYEERLNSICHSPAIDALNRSITYLAETQKISRDQSAVQIIEAIKELDTIWNDYVTMEGINKLKILLEKDKNINS